MKKDSLHRNVYWQHKLIGFFRNIDLPGFRKVSLLLPKLFFAKPANAPDQFIFTQFKKWLWIEPSKDNGVEVALYETGNYERGTLEIMRSILKPGDQFIDIGANIGVHSLFASDLVAEQGKVWSFEPLKANFENFEKNCQKNNIDNIVSFSCGIGAVRSKGLIHDNFDINKGAASFVVKAEGSNSYEIDILPLDLIVQQHNIVPKLIKIDVEGMESEVLKGALQTLEKFAPYLIVEFSQNRDEAPEARKDLFDLLQSFGMYTFYSLSSGKERTGRKKKILNFEELPIDDNVYCFPYLGKK